MPVTVSNNAEGLTENTVPSAANTGGTSGTACSAVEIGDDSSILALAAAGIYGSRGYRLDHAAGVSGPTSSNRLRWSLPETGRVVLAAYIRLRTAITATEDLIGIRHGAGVMGQLMLGADQKIRMWNATGSGIAGSVTTTALAVDTTYLVQMAATKGTTTTDGKLEWALYDAAGTLLETWSNAAVNAGTGDPASIWVGRSTGRVGAHVIDVDEIKAGPYASGWVDPVSPAPTASAGPDQTGMEPYALVTLDSSGSTTAIGTIVGHAWTQLSGPPVTLTSASTATPSFEAPCTMDGDPVTLQVTVTNTGSHTATDTVTVTPLPAPMARRNPAGTAWIPYRPLTRNPAGDGWT